MYRITLKNEILYAREGEKLGDVLLKNGKYVDHPCAGKGTCKKCTVLVNGQPQLSCQYVVNGDIEVSLPEKYEIVSETGAENSGKKTAEMCFALDIGTTTLALSLISVDEKSIIKRKCTVQM